MRKVLSIFGTRPEAIKLAPVIKALRAEPQDFVSRVCVTGQHRELFHSVLDLFGIRPDYDLPRRLLKSLGMWSPPLLAPLNYV